LRDAETLKQELRERTPSLCAALHQYSCSWFTYTVCTPQPRQHHTSAHATLPHDGDALMTVPVYQRLLHQVDQAKQRTHIIYCISRGISRGDALPSFDEHHTHTTTHTPHHLQPRSDTSQPTATSLRRLPPLLFPGPSRSFLSLVSTVLAVIDSILDGLVLSPTHQHHRHLLSPNSSRPAFD
jgi:hypothetical protein